MQGVAISFQAGPAMTSREPEWGSPSTGSAANGWGGPAEHVPLPLRVALNPVGLLVPARRPGRPPSSRVVVEHAAASRGFVVLRSAELRRQMRRIEPNVGMHPYDIVTVDRRGIAFAEPGVDARLELPWTRVSAVGVGTVGVDVRRVRALMLRVAVSRRAVVVPLVVVELRRGLVWDIAEEGEFLTAYRRMRASLAASGTRV